MEVLVSTIGDDFVKVHREKMHLFDSRVFLIICSIVEGKCTGIFVRQFSLF